MWTPGRKILPNLGFGVPWQSLSVLGQQTTEFVPHESPMRHPLQSVRERQVSLMRPIPHGRMAFYWS